MIEPIKKYGKVLADKTIQALSNRGWECYYTETKEECKKLVLELIAESGFKKIGIPGSTTVRQINLVESLTSQGYEVIQHWLPLSAEEKAKVIVEETRADVFIHSPNALSMNGEIVILDYMGNRIVGSSLGPKMLIFLAGVNKITEDLDSAVRRAWNVAAQINAIRLGKSVDELITFCLILFKKPIYITRGIVILINEQLGY